ncbi:MAG: YkgJ family cysteine cluster protein [Halobacteriovoraceae bacterium]|nr:YkgJ family cysteine cluster protein [Halobacteriovoraceae bacterium]
MSDFRDLQKKAEGSFDLFFQKYKSQMTCAEGCSRCCIGGLSVFAWEAAIITDWFFDLNSQQKEDWKKLQVHPSSKSSPFIDSDGEENEPCSFLRNDRCSIYEVRPSLCRTQGMALQFQESDGGSFRDWCPLNFQDLEAGPHESDDLNLNALNHMLATAQILHEKDSPESLGPQRVDLKSLWHYLSKL